MKNTFLDKLLNRIDRVGQGDLQAYLQAEYGADFEDHEFTIAVCGPPVSAAYYFPPNFRFMYKRDQADFFIAFTKDNCDRAMPGKPLTPSPANTLNTLA